MKIVYLTVVKKKKHLLDFEVDKLTNSIENVLSGDSLPTDVLLLKRTDLKQILKKVGFLIGQQNIE